jgi:hypothetical protein
LLQEALTYRIAEEEVVMVRQGNAVQREVVAMRGTRVGIREREQLPPRVAVVVQEGTNTKTTAVTTAAMEALPEIPNPLSRV